MRREQTCPGHSGLVCHEPFLEFRPLKAMLGLPLLSWVISSVTLMGCSLVPSSARFEAKAKTGQRALTDMSTGLGCRLGRESPRQDVEGGSCVLLILRNVKEKITELTFRSERIAEQNSDFGLLARS